MDSLHGLLVDYYPDDPYLNRLSKVQALSMLIYHPLEHYTWVGYTSPKTCDEGRVDGAMRGSCQLWVVWILVEFLNIRHRWAKVDASDASDEEKAAAKADLKWRTGNMVADLVLGVHWSVKGGIGLTEPVIGLLGLFGALVGGWQKWKGMK